MRTIEFKAKSTEGYAEPGALLKFKGLPKSHFAPIEDLFCAAPIPQARFKAIIYTEIEFVGIVTAVAYDNGEYNVNIEVCA